MKAYGHLTYEERDRIALLRSTGLGQAAIGIENIFVEVNKRNFLTPKHENELMHFRRPTTTINDLRVRRYGVSEVDPSGHF
jgi:hypothetical protein